MRGRCVTVIPSFSFCLEAFSLVFSFLLLARSLPRDLSCCSFLFLPLLSVHLFTLLALAVSSLLFPVLSLWLSTFLFHLAFVLVS